VKVTTECYNDGKMHIDGGLLFGKCVKLIFHVG